MRVSVIMPVYNKARFLQEALDSVLHGSFTDLELIAVDDASTDGSAAILARQNDPRMVIISSAVNKGPAAAAQQAIDRAQGEYLVRLDADDKATHDRISVQVAFMDAHPEIGVSGTWVRLFGAEEATWKFPIDHDACVARAFFDTPVSQGTSIMRKTTIDESGIRYDPSWPRVGEDRLYFTKLLAHTRLANLDRSLTWYRRGAQNISFGRDALADLIAVNRMVFQQLGIKADARELELHGYFKGRFEEPLTAAHMHELHAWKRSLEDQAARMEHIPSEAFDRELHDRWNYCFHRAADHGMAPAVAHLRASGWPLEHVIYLAKIRLKRLVKGTTRK